MASISSEWVEINDELGTNREWWTHPLAKRWLLSTTMGAVIDWRLELEHLVTQANSALLDFTDSATLLDRFGRSEKWPAVTEKTASQLYQWSLIQKFLGAPPAGIVVEIGGGFGNLARIGLLNSPKISEWHILDLPGMLAIQDTFLRSTLSPDLFRKVHFHRAEDLTADLIPNHDLSIAAFSVSEAPPERITTFCDDVFSKGARAWIVGQWAFVGRHEWLQHLLDELLRTHDYAWRPFIYSATDGWSTAEIQAKRIVGSQRGTSARLEDLAVQTNSRP
jgi:hypothetical protein